jgi:hypothetical protein
VTTNHLLLPSQRRKGVFSLPIAQPNSNSLGGKCKETTKGGRGGQADAVAESPISMTSHGNFSPNGALSQRV